LRFEFERVLREFVRTIGVPVDYRRESGAGFVLMAADFSFGKREEAEAFSWRKRQLNVHACNGRRTLFRKSGFATAYSAN